MSTEAYKKLGEAAWDAGLAVEYVWNDRFDYLLEAVEIDKTMFYNDDFDNEFYDAKFDGGGNDYEAERMWRE